MAAEREGVSGLFGLRAVFQWAFRGKCQTFHLPVGFFGCKRGWAGTISHCRDCPGFSDLTTE